jgi:hypothetical protein
LATVIKLVPASRATPTAQANPSPLVPNRGGNP